MMYKVLIVEDEMLVRVGLKTSIDWKKFDMDVIADAANGEAALAVYGNEAPDLIITDIRMPVMDGMKLISEIRKNDNKTKFIILSCLEEFEYARQAMSLNVSGYILKLTMTTREMEDVLARVYEELREQKKYAPAQKSKMEVGVLKEKVLKEFIFYHLYSETEFAGIMSGMDWKMTPDGLMLCIMEIARYSRLKSKFEDERGQLLQFTILNVLNEILENHGAGEAFHDHENRYMILLNLKGSTGWSEIRKRLLAIIGNIEKVMKSYFESAAYFGISARYDGFQNLKKMYDESSALLKDRYFLDTNLFFYPEINRATSGKSWIGSVKEKAALWERLGRERRLGLELKMDGLMNGPAPDEQSAKKAFAQLMQWALSDLGIMPDNAEPLLTESVEAVNRSADIWEAIDRLGCFLDETAKLSLNMLHVSSEVARTIEYICNHYGRPISLNEIAEYVSLSPGYLSNLFKREMNKNLIEYLTEFRIGKAKEMLRQTHLKSYEIAERVGFSDNGYFSRTFKRIAGTRPNEYRKKPVFNRNTGQDHETV